MLMVADSARPSDRISSSALPPTDNKRALIGCKRRLAVVTRSARKQCLPVGGREWAATKSLRFRTPGGRFWHTRPVRMAVCLMRVRAALTAPLRL